MRKFIYICNYQKHYLKFLNFSQILKINTDFSEDISLEELNSILQNQGVKLQFGTTEQQKQQDIQQILKLYKNLNKQVNDNSEQRINRLQQDLKIQQEKYKQQQASYDKQIQQLYDKQQKLTEMLENKQIENDNMRGQQQQLQKQHDDIYRRYDFCQKTITKLTNENAKLKDRIGELLQKKEIQTQDRQIVLTNQKQIQSIQILDEAIRNLFLDIYQVQLEKPTNFDVRLQVLAEAVSHVQQTYNTDMNQTTQTIQQLNQKVYELEQQLKQYQK